MGLPATNYSSEAVRRPAPRRKVLLVTANDQAQLTESQAVRYAADECLGATTLAQAVTRCADAPSLILVDAAVAWAEGPDACAKLRAETQGRIPLVLLAEPTSPAELIETCWRSGFEDCLLRPLRMGAIQARLEALADPPPAGAREPTQRTVLLYGERSSMQNRLQRLLERNGHRVLDRSVSAGLGAGGVAAVDLLLLRWDPAMLPGLLASLRGDPAFARVPALLVASGPRPATLADPQAAWVDEARLDALLGQANQALGCAAQALHAEDAVPFFCPVEFREWGAKTPGPWSTGLSYEVSSGGLFVQTLVPLRPKVAVELRVHLTTTREEVAATGVVAWSHRWAARRRPGMAVQFLGMPVSPKLKQLIELCRSGA